MATKVEEGKALKNFSAPMTSGKVFSLSEHKGKGIVLYFYPKDATPGCTLQGHEFTKLKNKFNQLNYEVYGISRDSLSSHEKFKDKQCYSIDLISDEDEAICNMFDVIKEKNMYGKKVFGIERSTFVINEKGVLLKEWRKVKAEGNAEQTLKYIKELE